MDNKGQVSADNAIKVVIGLTVIGLLVAFLLPVGLGAFYDASSVTYAQSQGETVQIVDTLNGTLDNADNVNNTIDVTIADGASSATITGLAEGTNETVTVNAEDITVTNENVTSSSKATVTYEYPKTYAWTDGASSLFLIVPLLLLLVVFLYIVGVALNAYA